MYFGKPEKNLERVFFADPWGFGVFNEKEFEEKRKIRMDTLPIWKRAMFKVLMSVGTNVKPLSFFRIDFLNNGYNHVGDSLFW